MPTKKQRPEVLSQSLNKEELILRIWELLTIAVFGTKNEKNLKQSVQAVKDLVHLKVNSKQGVLNFIAVYLWKWADPQVAEMISVHLKQILRLEAADQTTRTFWKLLDNLKQRLSSVTSSLNWWLNHAKSA